MKSCNQHVNEVNMYLRTAGVGPSSLKVVEKDLLNSVGTLIYTQHCHYFKKVGSKLVMDSLCVIP